MILGAVKKLAEISIARKKVLQNQHAVCVFCSKHDIEQAGM